MLYAVISVETKDFIKDSIDQQQPLSIMRLVEAALRPTSTTQCPSQSRQPHRVSGGRLGAQAGGIAVIGSSEARSRFTQDVTEMSARRRRMVWRRRSLLARGESAWKLG